MTWRTTCTLLTLLCLGLTGPAQAATIESKRNGLWSDASTWKPRKPRPGDKVRVRHRVEFDADHAGKKPLASVEVAGVLRFSTSTSTLLAVQDLIVEPRGELQIGDPGVPLPARVRATIEFAPWKPVSLSDPQAPMHLGLISMGGRVVLVGRGRDRVLRLPRGAAKGKRALDVPGADRAGWRAGDRVVFPASSFKRDRALKNEVVEIAQVSGDRVRFTQPLRFDHPAPAGQPVVLGNLGGNVILRSRSARLAERGHVMFMTSAQGAAGTVLLDGVVLQDLGRTDKGKTIARDNQKKMYPVHFHHTGVDTLHRVRGCAVVGSPGWGLVNHRSRVAMDGNVVYDFGGAAFVTEAGNERGSFVGNLAVGGKGIGGKKAYPYRRTYLGNGQRLRAADLGFHGDGFWMASPLVEVKDNVAAGNHGSGFFWYALGVDDAQIASRALQRREACDSVTVPRGALSQAERKRIGLSQAPRSWQAHPGEFLSLDLPLLGGVSRNTAYANFVGMRFRYLRSLNLVALRAFYGKALFGKRGALNDRVAREQDAMFPTTTTVRNSTLLNNEIGLHATYSTRLRFVGLLIATDQYRLGKFDPASKAFLNSAPTGIEMSHGSNYGHGFQQAKVKGYPAGLRASTDTTIFARPGGGDAQRITFKGCRVNVFERAEKLLRKIRK